MPTDLHQKQDSGYSLAGEGKWDCLTVRKDNSFSEKGNISDH